MLNGRVESVNLGIVGEFIGGQGDVQIFPPYFITE